MRWQLPRRPSRARERDRSTYVATPAATAPRRAARRDVLSRRCGPSVSLLGSYDARSLNWVTRSAVSGCRCAHKRTRAMMYYNQEMEAVGEQRLKLFSVPTGGRTTDRDPTTRRRKTARVGTRLAWRREWKAVAYILKSG